MFSPPQDRPPQFGGVSPQFLKLQNQSNLQFPRQALLVSVSVFLFGFVSDTIYTLFAPTYEPLLKPSHYLSN